MANKSLELTNDYSDSCTMVAVEIAERLLSKGKIPSILKIQGNLVDNVNTAPITPKRFGGRIIWGAHIVCSENGFIYDPMIGKKPVCLEDYCKIAFEGEVEMEISIGPDKIKEFIGRL